MATEWAPLLSHHSDTTGGIPTGFPSRKEAVAHAGTVLTAQPGIEYELMVRTGQEEWRSFAGGLTIAEVISMRWSG